MKAVVKFAKGKGFVELREVPEPVPGPGEIRVRVACAGICASDLHILNDDIAITIRPPVVMGHEFSGTVDRLGEGVTDWRPGALGSSVFPLGDWEAAFAMHAGRAGLKILFQPE